MPKSLVTIVSYIYGRRFISPKMTVESGAMKILA